MENRSQILNELQAETPLLLAASAVMPYRLPRGYFDHLPALVMDRLLAIPADIVPENRQAFGIPEGYFESLAGNILEKIRQDESDNEVSRELDEIVPLLNTISKRNVFALPQGYFEDLRVQAPRPAKVVAMKKMRGWMQYAAAAMVSGILVTGAFFYTNNSPADISRADNMDVPAELNKLSENELVKYLDNPEHTQMASNDPLLEVKNNIRTVSDEELGQYLNDHSDELVTTVAN